MTPFNFRGVKHIWVRTAVMKIYNFGALPVFRFEVSPILTTTSISRKSPTLYCLLPAYITVENTNLHFTFSFVISFAYCLFPSQSCLAVRFFKRDWGRSIVYKTSGGCWSYVHWCQNLWHLKYWSAKHTSIKPATLQGSTHCKWLGELVLPTCWNQLLTEVSQVRWWTWGWECYSSNAMQCNRRWFAWNGELVK